MARFSISSLLAAALVAGSLAGCDDHAAAPEPRPVEARVRAITVEPTSRTLFTGQRFTFSARVDADSGVPTAVAWRTSNASVATVHLHTGEVTAVAPGTTLLTATTTAPGPVLATSVSIIVIGRGPAGLVVTPGAVTLTEGSIHPLDISVDAAPGVVRTITCRSSAPSIAQAVRDPSETGCAVYGLVRGTATVTIASVVDPTITAAVGVTVLPLRRGITGVSVNPSNVRLAPGEARDIAVQVTTENAAEDRAFTAASSNQNVVRATVTTAGAGASATSALALTAVAPGMATVNVCRAAATNVCAQLGVTVESR